MLEISVIMSTYNEKLEHLHKAITSVRNRLLRTLSLSLFWIIHRIMSYETAFTITHKNDARIRIIENETNIGLTQSLNKAIKTANWHLYGTDGCR